MDPPCHPHAPAPPRSPAKLSSVDTVSCLIRNIEQLKNKDKLISQLEQDLGRQWAAARLAAMQSVRGEGADPVPGPSSPSLPGALPEASAAPDSFSWAATSAPTPWSVEEWSAGEPGHVMPDVPKKLKEKNKELVEKCRSYLQRSRELTLQTRGWRDSHEQAVRDNAKLVEVLEHHKMRLLQVTRQMAELKAERGQAVGQAGQVEALRAEMAQDRRTIAQLRQACNEKDRRIELIQHRRKRRRVMEYADKPPHLRETFYGYDEDTESSPPSTVSSRDDLASDPREDGAWEVAGRADCERQHRMLMMEHLQLQRSHSLLQREAGSLTDPQRAALAHAQTHQDLLTSQRRVEQLEQLITELGEGEIITLLKEREAILAENKELYDKTTVQQAEIQRLLQQLAVTVDSVEELEFRVMELENMEGDSGRGSPCPSSLVPSPVPETHPLTEEEGVSSQGGVSSEGGASACEMEAVVKEVAALLRGRGREAEAVIRKLNKYRDIQENAAAMEDMSRELQKQLVSLQTENDTLIDKLATLQASTEDQERTENLQLKVEIARLVKNETKLLSERDSLNDLIGVLKAKNTHLKQQLDLVTSGQVGVNKGQEVTSSDSASESPSVSPSESPKRRKSKSRGADETTPQSKKRRNNNNESLNNTNKLMKGINSPENSESVMNNESCHSDKLKAAQMKIKDLEAELKEIKDENMVLVKQLQKNLIQKSSEAETEADQPMMVDRLRDLEAELNLSQRENEALARQLRQRRDEDYDTRRGEGMDGVPELEEFCEDLQDRLTAAEAESRHLRDKMRLVEGIIHDSEASEMQLREEKDAVEAREQEVRGQLAATTRSVAELKDLISDRDCLEQALRMKVEFLQKAEEASVRRITELEQTERELRSALDGDGEADSGQAGNVTELRHQLTFLETDNKALSARVCELEENEEILRENWRRVAEDDLDKHQCLDHKVRMLEELNRELKAKLAAQDEMYLVTSQPSGGVTGSLAAELAGSKTSLAQPYSSSDSDSDTDAVKVEQRNIREKVKKLERTLSEVKDEKNTAIEGLREKIEGLKDNEIKLSETISEMEMTERELRAKLELYESSEVTVEKMLKYQSKIQELRTSQESLLDQLESMEHQGMTLQEQHAEMERTLRGHIVTLEVEARASKSQQIKAAARIRELEKVEKELTEKTAAQAEKENSLYVRISSLMDDLKAAREEGEELRGQREAMDEKIRKSKLLEVKLLEIEMEFGKKKSAMSSQLRHKEEELRQREVAHEEQVKVIQEEHEVKIMALEGDRDGLTMAVDELKAQMETMREGEEELRGVRKEVVSLRGLEESYENKIKELLEEMGSLKNDVVESKAKIEELITSNNALKDARIRSENQISEMSEELDVLRGSEKELEEMKSQLDSYKSIEQEGEEKLENMEQDLRDMKSKTEKSQNRVVELEKELHLKKQDIAEFETAMAKMKEDISEKVLNIESNIEKEEEVEKEKKLINEELNVKKNRIEELEQQVQSLNEYIVKLESECDQIRSDSISVEKDLRNRLEKIDNSMVDKERALKELKEVHVEDLEAERQDCKERVDQAIEESAQLKEKCTFTQQQLEQIQKVSDETKVELMQTKESFQTKIEEIKTLLQEKSDNLVIKEENISRLTSEITNISQMLEERSSELEHLKIKYDSDMSSMQQEQESLEKELRNKVMFLNTQLMQQVEEKERQKNSLQEKGDIEASLSSEVERLKVELQKHQIELKEKLNELDVKDEEKNELTVQISQINETLTSLQKEFDVARQDWIKTENNLEQQLENRDQTIHTVSNDYKNLHIQFSELEDKLCQRNISFEEMKSNYDDIQLQLSEKEKLVEETCRKEIIVQEQMQKNEQVLLEAGKTKQDHESELEKYFEQLQQTKSQLDENNTKFEENLIVISDFESKVSQLEKQLSEKEETVRYQKTQLQEKTSDIENLCVKLAEVETRFKESEANINSVQSAVESAKEQQQRELALAQAELVKVLGEVHTKEEALQLSAHESLQKDQALEVQERRCSELLEERQELVLKLEQHFQESSASKEEVNTAKAELKEVENRYRQLEDQVASLELKLEQRWVETQGDQDVLAQRQSQLQQLQANLDCAESRCTQSIAEYKQLEEELSLVKSECQAKVDEAVSKLKIANDEHEHQLAKLKDSRVEMEHKISDLSQKLKDREDKLQCSVVQTEQLENKISVMEKAIQEENNDLSQKLKESENKLQLSVVETERLENKISLIEKAMQEEGSLEVTLRDKQLECGYLNSEIEKLQHLLEDKQFECEGAYVKLKDSEVTINQMHQALQDQEAELAETQEQLVEKNIEINKIKSDVEHSKASSQDLDHQLENLKSELKSLEEENKVVTMKVKKSEESNVQNEHKYDVLQAKLESVQKDLNNVTEESKSKEENLLTLIQNLEDENKVLRTNIQNMEFTLAGNNMEIVDANAGLTEKIRLLEQEIKDNTERFEILDEKIDELTHEKECAVSNLKILQNAKHQADEENLSLHEELEEASQEFENLNIKLLKLRTEKEQVESKLKSEADEAELNLRIKKDEDEPRLTAPGGEATACAEAGAAPPGVPCLPEGGESQLKCGKEKEESRLFDLEEQLTLENSKALQLQGRVDSLLADNESLTQEVIDLNTEIDSLKERLTNDTIAVDSINLSTDSREKVGVESEAMVSSVNNVVSAAQITLICSNDNEMDSTASDDKSEPNMQELIQEINLFKEKNYTLQTCLHKHESSLQIMHEKEAKLLSRNEELVSKEKELLEQITDIEQTVIVPLETENEELKDEVAVLKQERDEARSKAGLDEDEMDATSLRKSLEDSLLAIEEFEKKNAILSQDLHVIERERDNLSDKVAELKSDKEDLEDKIQGLEVEVDRLQKLENDKTVVEEAENTLMDRVLDLEEKELQLKEQLRKSKTSESSLKDQLDYMKQKAEVLQDAEGKYMDRIMELEESQHRLQAELQEMKTELQDNVAVSRPKSSLTDLPECLESEPLMQVDELTLVNPSVAKTNESSLVMTESIIHAEIVPQELQMTESVIQPEFISQSDTCPTPHDNLPSQSDDSLQCNGATSLLNKSTASVDTSDLDNSTEMSETSHQLSLLESENKKLQEKLELLQESEARLMEKLDEAEVKNAELLAALPTKNNSSENSIKSSSEFELKMEALIEENEFLVENIETYKRLFKEEKSKVNEMQDRLQEDSFQLEEAQAMASEIQSEYEDQLASRDRQVQEARNQLATVQGCLRAREEEKDALLSRLTKLEASSSTHSNAAVTSEGHKCAIADLETRGRDLQTSVDTLTSQNERLMGSVDELSSERDQLRSELTERATHSDCLQESINHLTKHNADLQANITQLSTQNAELTVRLESVHQMEEGWRSQERIQRREMEGQVAALTQRKDELRALCREQEQRLQSELDAANQREASAMKALEALEAEVSQLRRSLRQQEVARLQGRSLDSGDSGVSADECRTDRSSPPGDAPHPVYASKATFVLTRPTDHPPSPRPASAAEVISRSRSPHDTSNKPRPHSSVGDASLLLGRASLVNHARCATPTDGRATPPGGPVAPPRHKKGKSRTSSFDSGSGSEGVSHANHVTSPFDHAYLKKRFEELEAQRLLSGATTEVNNDSSNNQVQECVVDSVTSSVDGVTSSAMLDKAEDVLQARIKELERLDAHHRGQLSELERDREALHEIARRDKATLHELTVRLRESQLSERGLKDQVTSLESSESSLFSKCEGLEVKCSKLEDRCHELEIHERRLRELVRKFKLDEEQWLSKSGGMETAVMELSGREQQLKRALKEMELEKGGSLEHQAYLEGRVRELEAVEVTLLQRVRNYENNEVTLQNRLVHLENHSTASSSKASELDVINADLAQRLQRSIEENAVISQHTTQLHGQVQELDRRLMTSRDSEVAYKQHVDSLQKNESALQKKVREYELREIDSQARIRELEQTSEIINDKLATLQRSENKLKYRVQELEGIGGQIPGELTPSQRQKIPQKLEDCQKRVLVLQSQVENLQLQLRKALSNDNTVSKSGESDTVSLPAAEFKKLQTQALVLGETERQLELLEGLNTGLSHTVMQLRQGKGASGHEVEIEVLKRRVESYKTLLETLKSDLPKEQATSLRDPHQDAVSSGESHGSERVLQAGGPAHTLSSAPRGPLTTQRGPSSQRGPLPTGASSKEERHWLDIEARAGDGSRGGATTPSLQVAGSQTRSAVEEEEVTLGVNLPSESELSSHHHDPSHNDTDDNSSVGGGPVPPPRRGRGSGTKLPGGHVVNSTHPGVSSCSESSEELTTSHPLAGTAHNNTNSSDNNARVVMNHKQSFGLHNKKSLPLLAQEQSLLHDAPLASFGDDSSFYLPSSAPEGDSLEEDSEAPPPLPAMGPPGEAHPLASTSRDTLDDLSMSFDATSTKRDSDNSMSIRDRISAIEKSLTSPSAPCDRDQGYWKTRHAEAMRSNEGLERDNKQYKEDINKLEKELEEKRRYIYILELWLSRCEDVLKNKDKQTDREIVESVQLDLNQLKKDLSQAGNCGDNTTMDAAALLTELERKDREIASKRSEIEVVRLELSRIRAERDGVETMRATALDSLRSLERELVGLQAGEAAVAEARGRLEQLQHKYDEMENYKNEAVKLVEPLQAQVERMSCAVKEKDALLHRLGAELRAMSHRPSSALDDLARLEAVSGDVRAQSLDDLEMACSDTDSAPSPRPHSAEPAQRGTPAHPRWGAHGVGGRGRASRGHFLPQGGQYVAVNSHDPALYSTSGRPAMELTVREGDHVLITGPVDECGYHEAVISGRAGLVPANILYPARLNGHHMTPTHDLSHDTRPEHMVDVYRRLSYPQPVPSSKTHPAPAPPSAPEPPHHLHVQEVRGDSSVLLAWQPPKLDAQGCSNGCKVLGYMVYVDHQEYEQLPHVSPSQLLLHGLDLSRSHFLAVQCLTSGGQASPRAELVFEGSIKLGQSRMETDLSSILNSAQYKRGHRKTVMALYDYSPAVQSPHDYTALELGFQAGDVLTVYGEPRQDGFYHGEINDKRGLVPAVFVEDVK